MYRKPKERLVLKWPHWGPVQIEEADGELQIFGQEESLRRVITESASKPKGLLLLLGLVFGGVGSENCNLTGHPEY